LFDDWLPRRKPRARNLTVPKHRQKADLFLECYRAADGISAAASRQWRLQYIAIL
jgi:hypothetical protein